MAKITWSELALEDLQSIHEYISRDSLFYATKQVDVILQRVSILAEQPKSGRIVPEFQNQNLRELIEGNYRIIYRLNSLDEIGIARVHHSAKLLRQL